MIVSARYAGMQPPEGPPICTALNFLSFCIPPPSLKIISLMLIPIGTSTSPERLIFPARANTFVPLLFSVPYLAYSSEPCNKIQGMLASVSTLLILVGFCHSPDSAGNGGRFLGIPLSPSTEAINAVSSPQTKAPAPSFI